MRDSEDPGVRQLSSRIDIYHFYSLRRRGTLSLVEKSHTFRVEDHGVNKTSAVCETLCGKSEGIS